MLCFKLVITSSMQITNTLQIISLQQKLFYLSMS
jgi:hypothetical protein